MLSTAFINIFLNAPFGLKGGEISSWKRDFHSSFKNKVAGGKSSKKYIS